MKVILPGSYDPVTIGHLEIIKKAASLYSKVYAVAFINPQKKYMFTKEERVAMLKLAAENLENVTIDSSDGYVIDYMREHGIEKIVKGYRNQDDLDYEKAQAEWNLKNGGYETEFWLCESKFADVSSTRARAVIGEGGDFLELLPPKVADFIKNRS